ncbi:MAG: DUF4397 domain-containing protein [Gemmatimonadota bacterium]
MTKVRFVPVLAALLFVAACGENGGPTAGGSTGGPTARVRFFNATMGMAGSGGFTTNGQFATGSALPFGQSTQTCATVAAGSTALGFGAANTGGTGLSGTALATLNDQSITAGGSYTVMATGSAASPRLFMLDNKFSGTLATSQAAVRLVNLAPGTGTTPNTFVAWAGGIGAGAPVAIDMEVGAATTYRTVTSGANTFALLQNPGHIIASPGTAVTLQAGTVNTLAIVPTTSGGVQLVVVPGC